MGPVISPFGGLPWWHAGESRVPSLMVSGLQSSGSRVLTEPAKMMTLVKVLATSLL